MGCHRTTVLRQIQCGYIKATSIFNERNQLVYQIPLSALHPEAQLRYFKEHGHPFPLATEKPASAKAYKPLDHFSAAEREEIRQEMETLERWQEYRRQPGRTAELDAEFVELLRQEDPGRAVSVKTLYRKKKALEETTLRGWWMAGARHGKAGAASTKRCGRRSSLSTLTCGNRKQRSATRQPSNMCAGIIRRWRMASRHTAPL